MNLLLISIFCSVSVGILFKLSKLSFSSLLWAIFCGYITCFVLGFLLFDVEFGTAHLSSKEFSIVAVLSILMPSIFIALKKSIEINGIAKTDLIQRMSLLIPVLGSFIFFDETISLVKIVALIVGFCSIYLMLHRNEKNIYNHQVFYLLFIFLGYGIVDLLFKSMTQTPFRLILLYVFLGCIATTLFYIIYKRPTYNLKAISIGIALGLLNFTNIFTYLNAHKQLADSPTIVFTCMNLGVICLGLFVGKFLFKEKISLRNFIGLICATFAIILLTYQMLI